LAQAGLLQDIRCMVGEWHAVAERGQTPASVMNNLRSILRPRTTSPSGSVRGRRWGIFRTCLLIKRQLLDQIGPLPCKAGLNIFDTDTLCQKAGYILACCKDLFIQHLGSRTFAQGGLAV
jgi:hypothetical protein